MEEIYVSDKTFQRENFTQNILPKGEYENCVFENCDFSGCNLSGFKFVEVVFNDCNLSLAKCSKTAWRNITFKGCKMLGLRFDESLEFGLEFSFENCTLTHSSFYQMKIKKTVFKNTQLQETDFTEADLTAAIFDNCDLHKAVFENTNLEKTDFRTAYSYAFNPDMNRLKKAKFSVAGIAGLLQKYDIEIS